MALVAVAVTMTLARPALAAGTSHGQSRAVSGALIPQAHVLGQTTHAKLALQPHYYNGSTNLYLAWTGDDSAHTLNIESTSDGVTWGNKFKLNVTSKAGVGPAMCDCTISGVYHLYFSWVGSDSHIRVGYYDDVSHTIAGLSTLSETTNNAPALTRFSDNQLYLAWTGTDSHLNVISSPNGISWGSKVTLNATASGGPGIAWALGQVYLDYSVDSINGSSPQLCSGYYSGSANLSNPVCPSALGAASGSDVALLSFNNVLYSPYAGIDFNNSLNVMKSTNGTSWSNTPYGDSAYYVGGTAWNNQVWVAWYFQGPDIQVAVRQP